MKQNIWILVLSAVAVTGLTLVHTHCDPIVMFLIACLFVGMFISQVANLLAGDE